MSLIPLWAKALVLAALAAAVWAWDAHRIGAAEERGRAEVRAKHAGAAEAAERRMRELQRAAELRYTVQAAARDRFIVETITEVRHAAAPLAACPVPEPVRVRLNAAAACATDDSAASCAGDGAVPHPGRAR